MAICFEHNLLLASALEQMGLVVEPLLARVRVGDAPPEGRAANHLVLRVSDADGVEWHADVGFGAGTLLDPIPFGPKGVQEQSGWSYQVVQDADELVLQTLGDEGWSDLYSFPPKTALRIDIEVNNWWTCTSPDSPFVTRLCVSIHHEDGRRQIMSDFSGSLVTMEISPEGRESRAEQRAAIPAL